MIFRLFIFILFGFNIIALNGQVPPDLIEVGQDAPKWMQLLTHQDPNVDEIQKEYKNFYTTNPFVKNSYTQYYKRYMRWARPFINVDGKIRIPDVNQFNNKERRAQSFRKSSKRTSAWTFVGPNETWHTDGSTKVTWQTNIYCIDIAPSNANVIYAGGESGGLWVTTDKGLNWSLKTKDIMHGAFTAVKVDPTNPDIAYTATNGKIIKTINGGNTWMTIYTETSLRVNEISISSTDPNIVIAATQSGLIRSVNGGVNWSKLFSDITWTVKKKEGSGTTFYAVRQNGISSDMIKSIDSGANWTVMNSGWFIATASEQVSGAIIATCPTNPNKIYAYLCGNGGTFLGYIGVFVSTDDGNSWSNTNPSNLIGGSYVIPTHTNLMANNGTTGFNQGFYDMAIVVNPNNENQLIAGGTSWFKSDDGGATWSGLGGYVSGLSWSHPDIQWCAASGNDLWIASDGGLNYSNDFGQSIEARMDGISGSDMWGFGSGWNTDILVGGRYHNGNMAYHESFPAGKFYRMGGAEAPTGYVNPGPGNKVMHSDIGGHKIKSGFGNGVDYFSIGAWPNESYAYFSNSDMVFHPNYYNTIYLGKDNTIQKSEDGGTSFTTLYTFPGTTSNEVYEIQISRSNPNIMYCSQYDGVDDKLWKSTDSGNTWSAITPLPLPNNNDRVKMAVSAESADVLWVAVTYGSNGKKIYKSIDGGTSWINLTSSILNNIQIQGIMAQYGTNGGIYLGTNAGGFYRNNTHSEWQPYSTGLPVSVETNRLRPFYRDNKIRNGCWGFGVWESELYEPSLPSAMPTVGAKSVGCARDTVFFDDYSVLNHSGASWVWAFPGASYVSNYNIRNPKVVYSNIGSYDVTLTITDGLNQTSTKTIIGMIYVENKCTVDTIPGKTLVASGNDKHGYVPDFGLIDVDSLTVTAWIKPVGIQPDYAAIFMGDGDDAAGFNFKDGTNKLAYHWPGGQWWWNSNINVPSDQWSFVALVVKPTGITVYCNEQSATHTFALTPTDIPSFRIGSYRNWGSRNMNGQIDEVAIYNRPLITSEIRDLRHLTKKPENDPSLIAYYQFNSDDVHDYDKVGINHVYLTAGATKQVSTAPVGGGFSHRLTINSGGIKDFGDADLKIYFPNSGNFPSGEVVVSKINLLPDVSPINSFPAKSYWVVNNYGSNTNFSLLDSISFYDTGNISSGCQIPSYKLYKRTANGEGNSWGSFLDLADYVNPYPPNHHVTFANGNNITNLGQFYVAIESKPNINVQEICNGLDDDCDGLIDEEYSLEVSATSDSGANSLRAILNCAQSGETITFAAGIDTITILSPLIIQKDIAFIDNIGNRVVIRANLSGSGFNLADGAIKIESNANVVFNNIQFIQLNNSETKPLVLNNGHLTLNECKLSGDPSTVFKHGNNSAFKAFGLVEID